MCAIMYHNNLFSKPSYPIDRVFVTIRIDWRYGLKRNNAWKCAYIILLAIKLLRVVANILELVLYVSNLYMPIGNIFLSRTAITLLMLVIIIIIIIHAQIRKVRYIEVTLSVLECLCE